MNFERIVRCFLAFLISALEVEVVLDGVANARGYFFFRVSSD